MLLAVILLSAVSCGASDIKCIDIKLTDEQYAFAVNKENAELLESVNSVVDTLTENGTLDSIVQKYFSGDEENYVQVPAGVIDISKKQLVVATSIPFKPFEFSKYETGKGKLYRGIDIEIATYIAEAIDAELVIKEMPFKDILNAVESGDADIAMAGLTINAERQEHIAFSHTYYEASQVLIVRTNDHTFDGCRTRTNVEDTLKGLNSTVTVGYQEDTTSGLYVMGDSGMGYEGFDVSVKSYDTALHAIQGLINGEVNYVIVDEGPAKIIINDLNN